jgi:hypothetical protein
MFMKEGDQEGEMVFDTNFSNQIEMLGYPSTYLAFNMGSMFCYFVTTIVCLLIMVGLGILAYLAKKLNCRCGPFKIRCFQYRYEKFKKFFLWNYIIRLIFEATMELSFCVLLNLKFGGLDSPGDLLAGEWFSIGCAIFLGLCVLASPIVIWVFYNRHFDKLHEEEFEETYGAGYDGLFVEKRAVLWFPILFTIRRMIFAVLCLYGRDVPFIQMAILSYITIVMCGFII